MLSPTESIRTACTWGTFFFFNKRIGQQCLQEKTIALNSGPWLLQLRSSANSWPWHLQFKSSVDESQPQAPRKQMHCHNPYPHAAATVLTTEIASWIRKRAASDLNSQPLEASSLRKLLPLTVAEPTIRPRAHPPYHTRFNSTRSLFLSPFLNLRAKTTNPIPIINQ